MKRVSRQFQFLKIPRASSSMRRTAFKEVQIGRSRWMKRSFKIDGRDHVSVD